MKSEENVKTTAFSQVFLWFGAAVSIAEIQTGALIAPLGLYKGLLSILSGHLIGAFVLYFAGLIGAETGLSSIESTRISFGTYGSCGFSVLNILQLLGWTAIMIVNGASALNVISEKMLAYKSHALWCILIGVFICVWILVGMKNLAKINVVIISALFALSVLLGFIVYRGNLNPLPAGTMAFGEGVELSAAMALSWLPLISDYTRDVKNKTAGTLGSVIGYFAGSTAMFAIGLGGALYAGTSDVAAILMPLGLSSAAFFIVVFSTVTTTFLDAYSAGVSAVNLSPKINVKAAAVFTCVLGVLLAIFVPASRYEAFLYLIGTVFAPLFAVLLTEYFILKKKSIGPPVLFNIKNTVLWVFGVILYRYLLSFNTPVGVTLPVMAAVGALSAAAGLKEKNK